MRFIIAFLILVHLNIWLIAQPSGDSYEPRITEINRNIYQENGRFGLLNSHKKPVTPPIYDTLYQINQALFAGKRENNIVNESLWGTIDENGNRILPFNFRKISVQNEMIVVGLQEKNLVRYGVYGLSGNMLLTPTYEEITVLSNNHIVAKKDNTTTFYDRNGNKLFQLEADSISNAQEGLIKTYRYGKISVIDLSNGAVLGKGYKQVRIEPEGITTTNFPAWTLVRGLDTLIFHYENVKAYKSNYAVSLYDKSWLVNRNDEVISYMYDSIVLDNKPFLLVSNDGKWGVINETGIEIIPVKYTNILSDQEFIYVKSGSVNDKWMVYDFYGYKKNKLDYDSLKTIAEGRIAIKRNGKWGYLDRYGFEIIPPIYDEAEKFKNDAARVSFFNADGIINRQGNWKLPPKAYKILDFDNNGVVVIKSGQYQIYDYQGTLVYFTNNRITLGAAGYLEYDSSNHVIREISQQGTIINRLDGTDGNLAGGAGLHVFMAHNKYGFKDFQGRIIIANRYDGVSSFNNGLAAVNINGKWGFIDLDEQLVIQPFYDSVGNFANNFCLTKRDDLMGVVNMHGQVIIQNTYQEIQPQADGQFKVNKDGHWGVLDGSGAVVIHPNFDQLTAVNQQFYIVQRNGKYGTITAQGVNKIPQFYDYINYDEQSKTLLLKLDKKEWVSLMKTHSIN